VARSFLREPLSNFLLLAELPYLANVGKKARSQ